MLPFRHDFRCETTLGLGSDLGSTKQSHSGLYCSVALIKFHQHNHKRRSKFRCKRQQLGNGSQVLKLKPLPPLPFLVALSSCSAKHSINPWNPRLIKSHSPNDKPRRGWAHASSGFYWFTKNFKRVRTAFGFQSMLQGPGAMRAQ